MSRALWLADVITDAGLHVKPYPGWETRGGADFTPRGVIWHHTVTRPTASDNTVDRILAIRGSSSVPPPLANISTNRDGTVSIIAAGTANHGGAGRWNGVTGNRYWVGDEMKNWGTADREPWADRQLESARIAAAAILNQINADESWLVAHKEYAKPPGRKVDPHTLNMDAERRTIQQRLEDDMTPEQADMLKALYDNYVALPLINTPTNPTAPQALARTYHRVMAGIDIDQADRDELIEAFVDEIEALDITVEVQARLTGPR